MHSNRATTNDISDSETSELQKIKNDRINLSKKEEQYRAGLISDREARIAAEGLEWLYEDLSRKKTEEDEREAYLLGKALPHSKDEFRRLDSRDDNFSSKNENTCVHTHQEIIQRIKEDPLYVIKNAEILQNRIISMNPLKKFQKRHKKKNYKEKAKKRKKPKKEYTDHSSKLKSENLTKNSRQYRKKIRNSASSNGSADFSLSPPSTRKNQKSIKIEVKHKLNKYKMQEKCSLNDGHSMNDDIAVKKICKDVSYTGETTKRFVGPKLCSDSSGAPKSCDSSYYAKSDLGPPRGMVKRAGEIESAALARLEERNRLIELRRQIEDNLVADDKKLISAMMRDGEQHEKEMKLRLEKIAKIEDLQRKIDEKSKGMKFMNKIKADVYMENTGTLEGRLKRNYARIKRNLSDND